MILGKYLVLYTKFINHGTKAKN